MSLAISSTAFNAGIQPRESTAPRSASGSGATVASSPAIKEPVDVVNIGSSGSETPSGNSGKFFEQSSEQLGLATNRTRYAIDLDSQEVIIKVIDPSTQQELRQIPSPEARKLAQQIRAYQSQQFNV